jgi:kynureninase
MILNRALAGQLDREDPLKDFGQKIFSEDKPMVYLDGNSLGKLPVATIRQQEELLHHKWGTRLIRSWNEGWYEMPISLGAKLAPLIGAGEAEVVYSDSTSMNLYKLAFSALQHQKGRKKIVSDTLNFPTDLYVLQGLINSMGNQHELVLARSEDGMTVSTQELERVIDDDTALVLLSHVVFKSGFLYDMEKVSALAHRKGALVLWDLSHSAGAVPVELNRCGADLAAGCSYKYLNGGPGAPAFLFVTEKLQEKLESPVWAWYGDSDPFAFNLKYSPAKGMKKFLVGTPPMLSLSAIEPALDLILEAGMDRLREKSLKQTQFLIDCAQEYLLPLGFSIGTPVKPEMRGSHVSLRHKEAYRICKALIDPDDGSIPVIPDFREPDNIRIGITPLYTSFTDVFEAIERLLSITKGRIYERYSAEKAAVT